MTLEPPRKQSKLSCAAWRPVERVSLQELTRSAYLERSWNRCPFIVDAGPNGCAMAYWWALKDGRWNDLTYLQNHPAVQARGDDRDAALTSFSNWTRVGVQVTSAKDALAQLLKREHLDPTGESLYLSAWEYDPPQNDGSGQDVSLAEDLAAGVPALPCLFGTAEHPALRTLSHLMRWIYVGEQGSACATHLDPLASHAWMWLSKGEKAWRIAALPQDLAWPAGADEADLFDEVAVASLASTAPMLRLWEACLRPGELLFVPSSTLHAVRNTSAGLTVAVSHNFIDVTCIAQTIRGLIAALMLLLDMEAKGAGRDDALERMSEQVDAPTMSLLAACLAVPAALADATREALSQLSEQDTQRKDALLSAWRQFSKLLTSAGASSP